MMERSTKFLSLTGWAGIMAGVYALTGAYIANSLIFFNTDAVIHEPIDLLVMSGDVLKLFLLAIVILVLAVGTAIYLSHRKSKKNGKRIWNSAARRLVMHMAIPLGTGGVFILFLVSYGLHGLIIPSTLIFYGLTLLNASKFALEEFKSLGIIEIVLGLTACYFVECSLIFWAVGFGIMHIIYGIYMHLRYEK